MIPVAIYIAPNWKHFYTSNGTTILGWGQKRLVIAWWMLNPF